MEHDLSQRLAEQLRYASGAGTSPAERRSCERSLPALAADLRSAGLGGVEMLIEYRLPLTSKRADVVLAGQDKDGEPAYVVVELKQWTEAHALEEDVNLVVVPGYGRPVSHPALQVEGYADYLIDFTATVAERPDSVLGVAYLHNATDQGVADLLGMPGGRRSRMFTGQRRGEFVAYLSEMFAPTSGAAAADALIGSRIAPSKQLLAVAAEEVQHREMFVLVATPDVDLDDQPCSTISVPCAVLSTRLRVHCRWSGGLRRFTQACQAPPRRRSLSMADGTHPLRGRLDRARS